MGSVLSFNRRIQAVDIDKIIEESIDYTKDELAVLNRSDLLQGYLSTGDKIVPVYRSLPYALEKASQNPLAGIGTPDLRLTGSFYAGIQVVVNFGQNSITTNSTDEKSEMLQNKYTPLIFGTTKQSKSLYALQTLKPVLFDNVKRAIGI